MFLTWKIIMTIIIVADIGTFMINKDKKQIQVSDIIGGFVGFLLRMSVIYYIWWF